MYTPRIAVSTNLPQRSSCRDRLVGTAAVPDRHTVPARHTAAPYRHLAAAVATQDRPGGAAAGSARLRQLPPPTPGHVVVPRGHGSKTNKLTCRAARSRHAVPSRLPTRSASRPAGGLRAGVRPGRIRANLILAMMVTLSSKFLLSIEPRYLNSSTTAPPNKTRRVPIRNPV